MLVDIVALWMGRILLFSLGLFFIAWTWYLIINKLANSNIYFKALCYHLLSERKEVESEVKNKIDMRLGRRWLVKYKKSWYTWELVKIEE